MHPPTHVVGLDEAWEWGRRTDTDRSPGEGTSEARGVQDEEEEDDDDHFLATKIDGDK